MSKTKEEILGVPAYSHECGSFIEVDTRQEVLKAMESYALQELNEYRERLKAEFKKGLYSFEFIISKIDSTSN